MSNENPFRLKSLPLFGAVFVVPATNKNTSILLDADIASDIVKMKRARLVKGEGKAEEWKISYSYGVTQKSA